MTRVPEGNPFENMHSMLRHPSSQITRLILAADRIYMRPATACVTGGPGFLARALTSYISCCFCQAVQVLANHRLQPILLGSPARVHANVPSALHCPLELGTNVHNYINDAFGMQP